MTTNETPSPAGDGIDLPDAPGKTMKVKCSGCGYSNIYERQVDCPISYCPDCGHSLHEERDRKADERAPGVSYLRTRLRQEVELVKAAVRLRVFKELATNVPDAGS